MTFKKLVLGLLSFVAVFTLVACSSSNSKNLQDDIKEKKKLVVAVQGSCER